MAKIQPTSPAQSAPQPAHASAPPKSLTSVWGGSKQWCYFWSENGGPGSRRASNIDRKTTPSRTLPAPRRAPNGAPERPSEAPKATPWQTLPAPRRAPNGVPECPSETSKTTPSRTLLHLGELQTGLQNVHPRHPKRSWQTLPAPRTAPIRKRCSKTLIRDTQSPTPYVSEVP